MLRQMFLFSISILPQKAKLFKKRVCLFLFFEKYYFLKTQNL